MIILCGFFHYIPPYHHVECVFAILLRKVEGQFHVSAMHSRGEPDLHMNINADVV